MSEEKVTTTVSANSKAIVMNDLPKAQSRVEDYLDYLCGRATVLADLPKPKSRVEEFLEYLCYNRGQAGGGQNPDEAFIGATIQNNTITFTKQNGTTHDVNLDDIIPNSTKESIKEIRVEGKELVLTKVDNSELRVDLTQLLSAINISFNNANSGLTSDNVQGAIDEIKNLISLLQANNTTTYFVNNNTEFEQLKQTTTFVSGDIVYVIDSTGVEDYTGTDVDNAGKVVSLIYDEKVSGFRILSKDRDDVVLNANLVTVNPTINRLNNVQEVLEDLDNRLNARFDTTLVNASYEKDTNVLTFTKGDNTREEVELKHFVERWGDLDYLTEHKVVNIFNKNDVINSQHHHANGVITYEPEWCRYVVPCEPNEIIGIVKKEHDSQVITFLDERGNRISSENFPPKNSNGWKYYKITVPNNSNIKQLSVNIYKPTNPLDDDTVMIYRGDKEPTTEFYPFANGYSVIIDGSKVALTFDPTGSSLTSSTTHDAIKELDGKIANAGGGTVTSVNGQQGNVTLNATHISANVGGSDNTVQAHLQKINGDATTLNGSVTTLRNELRTTLANEINAHGTRISKLERKLPTVQVGDIIQTFKDSGDTYTVGGVTYLYIGKIRTISHAAYPNLAPALGLSNVNNYQLPVISDINVTFDNGTKSRARKHYIVAHIG